MLIRARSTTDSVCSHGIKGLNELSAQHLEQILCVASTDRELRQNFYHELIQLSCLTDSQFERVASVLQHRVVDEMRLLRQLDRQGPLPEVIQACIYHGDFAVQERLLELSELTRDHVEQLHERGANRRLRNMAGQMLRSRRFQR